MLWPRLAAVTVSPGGGRCLPVVLSGLAALGTWDLLQTRHTILRVYPILGHVRFLMELIRPEIRQYFIESNTEATPFDRETRDMVYERAKGTKGDEPFGTERDVYAHRLRIPAALAAGARSPTISNPGSGSAVRTARSPMTLRC